ncbi:hypothetical protein N7533_012920 [Penicillium manginii]|uniref:uncharacterized protein n=1 Tax=Penicillium manginii TaxID=203109 RepID=UPI002546B43F|nr:uncharacterized protein N7533_012920 [Penicillium manginii]KAJ5734517.1 hypothetical protein N7533_012920 [Penicillium manginii]
MSSNEEIGSSHDDAGYRGIIKQPYIFFLAFFSSIGGMLFGYDQGVISGVLVMNNFGKQFPVLAANATLQGWMVSILTLGAMIGALANGPIADRLSRRWSILLANSIFLVGSIIQAASVNTAMLFIGRFIAGLAIGQLSMASITLGIMVAFWLDYGTTNIGGTGDGQSPIAWRLPLALQCVPSLILASGTFFLPYSPRWLLMKDREEEARATLVRIRQVSENSPCIESELLEIKAAAIFDNETSDLLYPNANTNIQLTIERYKALFTVGHLRRRLVIACTMQVIQQFTGINAIIYYAPQIFRNIGLSGNSVDLLATGVIGVVNFLSTIPAIMYMDRWGRRKVLIIGGIGMGISQLIVGTIYAVYKDSWASHKSAGWAAASFVWIYIANFAFSIGCTNWIIPSEIFSPGVRAQGVGIAIGVNWLSNFVVALIISQNASKYSTFGTFYFFLAFCIGLIFWTFFMLPETKGVGIEEMDKLFGGNQGEADINRMRDIREGWDLTLETWKFRKIFILRCPKSKRCRWVHSK